MTNKNREDIEKWYDTNANIYKSLAKKVRKLIEEIIEIEQVPYNSISYRRKDKQSYCNKAMKDKYNNPTNEIQDLAGIRIIAYVNSDVKKICDIIEREFQIDIANSENKIKMLGTDKVGYMSIHYVAKLSKQRASLPEYKMFKDLCFEIQVRTLLQHTWAEIEHDRNYKFGGKLPEHIIRKFSLIAANLELLDMQFDDISKEIDIYANAVEENVKDDNLENIFIDSTSIKKYLENKFRKEIKNNQLDPTLGGSDYEETIIDELNNFGIKTLKQLDDLFLSKFNYKIEDNNFLGLLRDYMMLNDIDKYFNKCWNNGWIFDNPEEFEIFNNNNIDINHILDMYPVWDPDED